MAESALVQADVQRMSKLRELSTSGKIDHQSSYFNHLIDIYKNIGRTGGQRTFTDRERERVDMFLNSFAKKNSR